MKITRKLGLISMHLVLMSYFVANAQTVSNKPPLSLNDFHNWTQVGDHNINAEGTYVFYFIDDEDAGTHILHLRSLKTNKEIVFNNASNAHFSKDGTILMSILSGNKLFLYHLASTKADSVQNVSNYTSFLNGGNNVIAFKKEDNKTLNILNLRTGRMWVYGDFINYFFSPDYKTLVLTKKFGDISQESINVVDWETRKETTVWKGPHPENLTFNKSSREFGFTVNDNNGTDSAGNSIWLYILGQKQATQLLNNKTKGLDSHFVLGSMDQFVAGGKSILFTFRRPMPPAKSKTMKAEVDVYSYSDPVPYSLQLAELKDSSRKDDYEGIYNIDRNQIVRIQKKDEIGFSMFDDANDSYILIDRTSNGDNEFSDSRNLFLVSAINGEEVSIPKGPLLTVGSPNGKFIILGDTNLYSYEFKTGKLVPLTSGLPVPHTDSQFVDDEYQCVFTFSSWEEGTGKALISDNYDLWEIDPTGKSEPVNVTNGFGRKNHILFGVANMNYSQDFADIIAKEKSDKPIFLKSYNYDTGDNDYYTVNLSEQADPRRMTNGGYAYEGINANGGSPPSSFGDNYKAANAPVYLLQRIDVKSINLVVTTDFKTFKPVSDNHPERNFNWYSSEMVEFNGLDHSLIHGVLYKPENFDPNKKYPVIFYFYQFMSNRLHRYNEPELSEAVINIPYYVSNGYLVFTPDIDAKYTNGIAAQYALNSVLGAANYVSKLPFVDSSKMAIMGHSWGGFESNYIVTHTSKFAAAVTGSGPSDAVGDYGTSDIDGSMPFSFKISYDNVQGTIYDNLNTFIKNSPKLYADKVTTPILFMHNKNDNAVPFRNGESFFYSLWKLRKKAWLLQYDREDHTIENEDDKLDYTIRLKQFFDHYLMNAPAPKWMVEGIRASMKGIDDGLQLEPAGVEPKSNPSH
jgi:dipeptidyl aminopeptidase/acylaminoacyl peptidase